MIVRLPAVAAIAALVVGATALATGDGTAGATTHAGDPDGLPVVSPQPVSMRRIGADLHLSPRATVRVVSRPGTRQAAATLAGDLGESNRVVTQPRLNPQESGELTVVLESGSPSAEVAAVLRDWNLPLPDHLAAGGYVLGIGHHQGKPLAVAVGKDDAGAFYAAQTFSQLSKTSTAGTTVASVAVVDEPAFALRGGMESFYGQPWRQADLLNHLDFLGRHKMNAFQYTVSGDPHTAGRAWRDLYTGADITRMRDAISRARANHVEFIYRINPEANVDEAYRICHSSQADKDALIARYQQLWELGERVFSIGWDDITQGFVCSQDQQRFGSDPSPLAAAQAHVLNDVYNRFILAHPGTRLVTVPTEYWGTGGSTYRTRYAQLIPAEVDIFWTGRDVVSKTITSADLDAASAAFGGRKLLIFDNYPVNDYAPNAQHLGPLVGRDAGLPAKATGFLANEMQEAEASLISLFTVGEYAWNPAAYNAAESWQRAINEIGGSVAPALRRYAEVNQGSPLHDDPAPALRTLVRNFVTAYRGGADLTAPGSALATYLDELARAPATLRSGMNNPSFLADSEPWLVKTEWRARAGVAAARGLQAKAAGDLGGYRTYRGQMHSALAQADTSLKLVAPGALDDLLDLADVAVGNDVVRNDSGAMSVYKRGRNGRVQSTWQSTAGGNWSPVTDLSPVSAAGSPEVVVRRNGALSAFVRGTDGLLKVSNQAVPGGSWSAWTNLSSTPVSGDPTALVGDDGQISVFARATDGRVQTSWQTAGGWSAPATLPGITIHGTPAVSIGLDGAMVMVARGTDNQLWTNWQTAPGGNWHGWVALAGSVASDPDLVMSHNGGFSAFYRRTDNQVATIWQLGRGGSWSGPAVLSGRATQGAPDVVLGNDGALVIFARGTDNRAWTIWQTSPGGSWSHWAWINSAEVAQSDVHAIDSSVGAGSVFTIDGAGHLRTAWQSGAGTNWSHWADLGGTLTS
jgi:beta-N-acetylglucosaminidase/Glycosyl hydrolase family 20, domain 2